MNGTRKDNPDSHFPASGEYVKAADGAWYGMTPNGHLSNLSAHQVTEHADGTITVSPSILVKQGEVEVWHGFLKAGVWEACGHYWESKSA